MCYSNVLYLCLPLVCLTYQFGRAVLKLLPINLSISCPINCHFVYFKMILSSAFIFIMIMYSYSIVTLINMMQPSLPLMVLPLILFNQIFISLVQFSLGFHLYNIYFIFLLLA